MPVPQRAVGDLRIAAKLRGRRSVIAGLRQQGSLKALFPRVRGDALDCVFLNTAGGLTGGDRMRISVTAEAGSYAVLSSQAAERAYRAKSPEIARSDVTLKVQAGARIDWIPQETILFDSAALSRRMTVDLEGDASALLVEPVIFGRQAMGEDVRNLAFTDQWRVSRDGQLVFADAIRMTGDATARLSGNATGQGARAMATVLLASPLAAARYGAVVTTGLSGASLISDDLLLVRVLARDGFDLRRQLIPIIAALRDVPLPRVWSL